MQSSDYDTTLSVLARQVLIRETHSFAECVKLVYEPTDRLLCDLAEQNPQSLLCFHSKTFESKHELPKSKILRFILLVIRWIFGEKKALYVDVDIVGPNGKTAYLGTVVNQRKAKDVFEWYVTTYRKFPNAIATLKQQGYTGIIRDRRGRKIPVEPDTLNESGLSIGVQKFLKKTFPQLADLLILWIPEPDNTALSEYVWQEAKRIAVAQTSEERRRIIEDDFDGQ